MALPESTTEENGAVPALARGIVVVGLLYLFLIGVSLLEGGIKGLGSDIQDELFSSVMNTMASGGGPFNLLQQQEQQQEQQQQQ